MTTVAFNPTSSNPGVAFDLSATDTVFNFASLLSATNGFVAGASYTQASVVNAGGETLNGTAAWAVIVHNVDGTHDQGTFSLAISDPGTAITANQASVWTDPHGSLNATLPADTGSTATGTVTAHATF